MILVTGGAGFIGSQIVAGLNAIGRSDILIVDHLGQSDKYLNLNALDFIDIRDRSELDDVLREWAGDIEVVLHQGACSATTEKDMDYLLMNNLRVSQELFDFCQRRGIPYLYASSASVYGNGERGFREERSCEQPLNGYASSKHLFDQWMRRQDVRIPVAGLRYFNVYGPQENHKGRMASVIWQFYRQYQKDGVFRIFDGSETFLRDFIHVRDVVDVNLHLMHRMLRGEMTGLHLLNVGTGQARSFMDIADLLLREWPNARLEKIPFPTDLQGKYQKFTQADVSALRLQGFHADFTSLEEGVRSYARNLVERDGFLEHPSRLP
jgi:ADP-L-glycero-D-manno-heptose 6-epimerase